MNKEIYFKVAKRQITISFFVWLIMWVITCFTYWELINPFQWIINLPDLIYWERLTIIICIGMYYFVSIDMLYDHFKSQTK